MYFTSKVQIFGYCLCKSLSNPSLSFSYKLNSSGATIAANQEVMAIPSGFLKLSLLLLIFIFQNCFTWIIEELIYSLRDWCPGALFFFFLLVSFFCDMPFRLYQEATILLSLTEWKPI